MKGVLKSEAPDAAKVAQLKAARLPHCTTVAVGCECCPPPPLPASPSTPPIVCLMHRVVFACHALLCRP